jgi:probable rRNA maturation factor
LILVNPARPGIDSAELTRFARLAQRCTGVSGQVDILITGNQRLKKLNRRFRKKDKATDVLSFPRQRGDGGDIAISVEIAAENAARYGHGPSEELKILILHGMLHLAGYDHERDNGEMAARETALRKRFGLPTALIERAKTSSAKRQDRRVTTKISRSSTARPAASRGRCSRMAAEPVLRRIPKDQNHSAVDRVSKREPRK